MPLTGKGTEIKSALVKEYGEKKGEEVLYAGKNSGRFTGIDDAFKAMCDSVGAMRDACRTDAPYEEWDPKTKKYRKIMRAQINLETEKMTEKINEERRTQTDYHSPENWARRSVAMDPNIKDKVFENGKLVFGAGRRWDAMCDSIDRMRAACDDRRVIGGMRHKTPK